MNEIKRWDLASLGDGFIGMKKTDDGSFVRHADHEAEVARLRAEAEKNRVDAERYRWLRNADNYPSPIGGFWNCLGETSEPEEMDEYIDAAMGTSA